MKKLSTYLVITMLTVCLSTVTLARDWFVGSDAVNDFSSIQDALDCPDVKSGDEIIVMPGVYEECIDVPSYLNVHIISDQGPDNTVIMPPEQIHNGPKMTVLIRSAAVFEGFTVMENPMNVSFQSYPFGLEDIPDPHAFHDNTAGITVTGPGKVRDNVVQGHRFGILGECPSGALGIPAEVTGNEVMENDMGINCCETNMLVRDNIAHHNKWVGILCGHASSGDVINNLIYENGTPGRAVSSGILCWQDYELQPDYMLCPMISYNTIHGNYGDGVHCRWAAGSPNVPILVGNIITENQGYGVISVEEPGLEAYRPRPVIRCCNIWGNANGRTLNIPRIANCISVDPQFEDGFYLNRRSLCRNQGELPVTSGTTSAGGNPDSGYADLGYHYPGFSTMAPVHLGDSIR